MEQKNNSWVTIRVLPHHKYDYEDDRLILFRIPEPNNQYLRVLIAKKDVVFSPVTHHYEIKINKHYNYLIWKWNNLSQKNDRYAIWKGEELLYFCKEQSESNS
ncbi:hypothetical protein [Spiroplasma sp. DGKH1]|uniref:hypothetical protein n=1 Tax=Spiroplasma sp. DGKH1 TaxID=3050074 RepID=UPI0034C5BE93